MENHGRGDTAFSPCDTPPNMYVYKTRKEVRKRKNGATVKREREREGIERWKGEDDGAR